MAKRMDCYEYLMRNGRDFFDENGDSDEEVNSEVEIVFSIDSELHSRLEDECGEQNCTIPEYLTGLIEREVG
jgi:hypothetical protein